MKETKLLLLVALTTLIPLFSARSIHYLKDDINASNSTNENN